MTNTPELIGHHRVIGGLRPGRHATTFIAMKGEAYDLGERTAAFGESAIAVCVGIVETGITRPLVSQLVRAATSVGANYCEADNAESPRDFRHKIGLCRKESSESKHWCRMLARAVPDKQQDIRALWREAHQLNLIFSKIVRSTQTD